MILQGENIISGGSSIQIGTRFVFTGNTSPIGCMLCDGRALSRTNYAVLFSVIGTIYGSGDGSNTFNIPDYSAEPETWYIKVSNHGILPVNAIDDTQITNANTFSAEYINNKTQTLRYNANFTLPTFLDGTRVRVANTHTTNTITCTLPTGQTMNGQSTFTIAPDTLLEFELIGTAWKCVSNTPELIWTNPSPTSDYTGGTIATSGFSRYMITLKWQKSESECNTINVLIGDSIINRVLNIFAYRPITATRTSIVIGTGYLYAVYNGAREIRNDVCMPIKIYGIK